MTYQEAYQKATGELKAAGIPEPESDSWILLEHVTGMTRTRYYVDGFERMPKNEEDRFFELVSCRKTRIPVQHLTGVQDRFRLYPNQPETEKSADCHRRCRYFRRSSESG